MPENTTKTPLPPPLKPINNTKSIPHSRYIPGRTRHQIPSSPPDEDLIPPVENVVLDPTDPVETPVETLVEAVRIPDITGNGEDDDDLDDTGDTGDTDDEIDENDNDSPYDPKESDLLAESTQHKKELISERGGRPRRDAMPPGTAPPVDYKVPTPRYRVFKSDATSPNQRSKAFYNWWNTLPQWAKDKTLLYVYRDWPVLKPVPEGAGEYAYIDKIDGNNPIQDDVDLLHRYGAGSYKLLFNQVPGGNLVTVYVVNIGMGDLRSNPPTDRRVADVNQVDFDNPANKSYVEFLRIVGRHPDQIKGEGEEDMANTTVVERALDMIENNNKQLAAAAANSNRPDESGAVSLVMDAARRSHELMQDGITKVLEKVEIAKAANNGGGGSGPMSLSDMMELMRQMMEMTRSMQPEPVAVGDGRSEITDGVTEQINALNAKILEMQKEHNREVMRMQQENFNMQLEHLRDEIRQQREAEPNPAVEEAAGEMAPKWLRPYMPIVAPVLQALAMKFLAPGQPMPGQPGMAGMPPMPMTPNPMQPQLQPQPAAPMNVLPAPVAPGAEIPADATAQINQVISLIAPGLMNSLRSGRSGLEFVDTFIEWLGEQAYDEIIQFGEEPIKAALYAHGGLGPQLRMFPDDRVALFVREFVNYDALTAETAAPATTSAAAPTATSTADKPIAVMIPKPDGAA